MTDSINFYRPVITISMADLGSAANEPRAISSTKELKHALYARCASQPADRVFTQQDLLAFDVTPNGDLKQLQACTTQLSKEGLLKMMTRDGKLCWKLVKKEDAAKYGRLLFSFADACADETLSP